MPSAKIDEMTALVYPVNGYPGMDLSHRQTSKTALVRDWSSQPPSSSGAIGKASTVPFNVSDDASHVGRICVQSGMGQMGNRRQQDDAASLDLVVVGQTKEEVGQFEEIPVLSSGDGDAVSV